MGIEKLTTSLIEEANKEAAEIVKTAEWHVEQMRKDEQSKEGSLKDTAREEVKKSLNEQKNERLAWARLEAKRIIAEAKEDAISNSLEGFFSELKGIGKDAAYREFLKVSVEDAVKELGGKTIIHVRKEDAPVLGKQEGNRVATDLEGLGGAIVESEDGSVRIDLRLETHFELERDALRKEVYTKLFEKQ